MQCRKACINGKLSYVLRIVNANRGQRVMPAQQPEHALDNAESYVQYPYFGYGTLLGRTQMRRQYPSAEDLGIAFFDQHRLDFWQYADASDGGCTIVYDADALLFGSLYRLALPDMRKLLKVGGVAEWYELRKLDVTLVTGGRVRAITLRVEGNRGPWVPPADYAQLVTDGAVEAGLPVAYCEKLNGIVAEARQG